MKKPIIIAIALVLIAIVIFVIKTKVIDKKTSTTDTAGLGSQIFENLNQNPAEKIPDVNPLKGDINPLEGVYQNPFE